MSQYSPLLLVLVILCVASSKSISGKVIEVDVICKEASNPSYCSNLLNSKPGGAKGVDLVDLAQYTLDVFNKNLTSTKRLIADLENAANDTELQYYYSCSTVMVDISIRIGDAGRDLYYKQYPSMAKHTAEVMPYILECNDSLHKFKTSPLLAKYVDLLRQDVLVIQIVVKYLNLGK